MSVEKLKNGATLVGTMLRLTKTQLLLWLQKMLVSILLCPIWNTALTILKL